MSGKMYPSDISREQFEAVRSILEGARQHKTAPRKVDLYDVFCAILYLLKNGCTWRGIPGNFPLWTTVWYYFDLWSRTSSDDTPSLLEQALKKSGAARAVMPWQSGLNDFLHHRCAKRQEYEQRAAEGG